MCVCNPVSCEEMREDSHASFMLEYTHNMGGGARIDFVHSCGWLLGLMGVHMELVHVRFPSPLTGDVRPCTVCYHWKRA